MHHFYSVIIGSELLNGRRVDKHFAFFNQELRNRGFLHVNSIILQDNPTLIQNCFNMILQDKQSVMFCFGGIGATPDDLTRAIASEVFTGQDLSLHVKAKELIEAQYKDDAYPHRINMAMLPPSSSLLHNPVNNIPGFDLFHRFFFVPGFPSMAWPMVKEALDTYFPSRPKSFNTSFIVETTENDLIEIMKALPKELIFSSLPHIENEKRSVEIYLEHAEQSVVEHWSYFFKNEAIKKGKIITDC